MSALMEQHERWSEARERLWPVARSAPRLRLVPPPEPPAPIPEMVVLPQLIDRHGWPIYCEPVPYDQFDGQMVTPPRITWKQIALQVAAKHKVSLIDIRSPRRDRPTVRARHEAFWRMKQETRLSLPQIGRFMGGRDHTTVLHGIRKHEERMLEAEQ